MMKMLNSLIKKETDEHIKFMQKQAENSYTVKDFLKKNLSTYYKTYDITKDTNINLNVNDTNNKDVYTVNNIIPKYKLNVKLSELLNSLSRFIHDLGSFDMIISNIQTDKNADILMREYIDKYFYNSGHLWNT